MSDDRLPALFERAVELDAAGRAALLAELRRDDAGLAAQLERLLRFAASEPSPIDGSAWRGSDSAAGVSPAPEPLPERVGRFRILRELGRGGMGRVFLAEEETADFRRTVALKLVDRFGPDREAIRRFRAEVRILASLEHPGIARFLDGGRSPEGIWFLALEYVDGRELIDHARAAGLSVRARVELFAAVLDAVAYAHGRGVIHRDLKPSNLLVGSDGRPRLLDFGISKLVEPGADAAAPTLTDWRPLTPAYASPEQLAGEPVSPRSDVYSLGVVLYELLTGSRPFASAGFSRGALERAVLEREPEPPSSVARRAERAGADTTEPAWLPARRRAIDRDLDALCLKALRRAPGQRYDGAAAFLADLRRYLSGARLEARAEGWRARAGRALRGRRAGVALVAGFVLLAALVAFAVAVSRRDGAPRAAAAGATPRGFPFDPGNPPPAEQSERRLAEAPEDLVAGSALALRLARDERLDEARIVVGRMRQVPGGDLDPLLDYAEGRIASVEGEDQRALVFFTRARDRALAVGRADLLGTIRTSRAATLSKLGQRDASRAELELARADSERIGDRRTLYRTLNGLALEHLQRGEMAEGEKDLEDALAAADAAGVEPVVTLQNLAAVHGVRGRPDLGEPLARRLIDYYRKAKRPSDEGEIATNLALMLRDLGRGAESAAEFEHAFALLRGSHNDNGLADALYARGVGDLEEARFERIDALVAELEATSQKSMKRLSLGYARGLLARRAALAGDLAGARAAFAEARQLLLADGNPDLAAMSDLAWAELEAGAGEPAAARAVLGEALARLDQPAGTQAGYLAEALSARIDARAGEGAAARARLAALAPEAERATALDWRLAHLRARAALAATEGRAGAARDDLAAALELARRMGHRVVELELRLDLAGVEPSPATARALAGEVARAAAALGLEALAARARRAALAPAAL